MANVETDVFYFKDDVGKNLYRKKTYYTLCIEQDVLANNKDEADQKFLDGGGIAHSRLVKILQIPTKVLKHIWLTLTILNQMTQSLSVR